MLIRHQPCGHPSSQVSFGAFESIDFEQSITFVVNVNLSAPSELIWLNLLGLPSVESRTSSFINDVF